MRKKGKRKVTHNVWDFREWENEWQRNITKDEEAVITPNTITSKSMRI